MFNCCYCVRMVVVQTPTLPSGIGQTTVGFSMDAVPCAMNGRVPLLSVQCLVHSPTEGCQPHHHHQGQAEYRAVQQ